MDRRVWLRWLVGLSAVALLALLIVYIYDLGVAHGLAQGTGAAGREAPVVGWWRPWGFGFGFFPFFPFFLILLWFAVLRGFLWRGPWYGRRWYGRGWNDGRDGIPPAFEEWHRRMHDRQEGPAAGTKG